MADEDIWSWSTTAANNGTADSGISWPEGQTRASVNNSARAMMAAHAKHRDLVSGKITVTGSVNALTFLSGLNYLTTPDGLTARLKIPEALLNTGPCTLEMDSRGPAAIINNSGDQLGGGELAGYQDFRWDGTNWILLSVGASGISTGDVKFTIKIIADPGWVMMDDGSIGSAASGASTASNSTQQLFNLLFNNITDDWCAITTSTGTATTRAAQSNAATAWTANCRIDLPKMLGRALAAAGSGSGLITRPLGSYAGAETETQTIAKLAMHNHAIGTYGAPDLVGALHSQWPWGQNGSYDSLGTSPDAVQYTGSNEPMNIRDPSLFLNVMIKL